jgi:hypothetical protein
MKLKSRKNRRYLIEGVSSNYITNSNNLQKLAVVEIIRFQNFMVLALSFNALSW